MLSKEQQALRVYMGTADMMRRHFDEASKKGRGDGERRTFEDFRDAQMYLCLWYATLYVVAEGFKDELKESDAEIDALLKSNRDTDPKVDPKTNLDHLRLFRNGVFHFQAGEYFDKKVMGLITEGDDVMMWVSSLHEALARWFYDKRREAPPTTT